jgi:DNA repair exonuclease SbcCD nuclease subunit
MRLLLFADLHLDAPFAWAPDALARTRRRALKECLTRIAALATRLGCDALCCAGDLYEQDRFTPDTAEFLRQTFAALHPLPVLLAPGNHDWLGPRSLYRQVRWSDNVHLFTEARLAPHPLADGFTVWGAAHRAPANTPGPLDGFQVDRGGVNIALFHGSEQGDLTFQERGKVPHAPFKAGQIAAAGLHHALVGHFHAPRDAEHHTYPGNPEPLTFGETGERGAVLVRVDEAGRVSRERHRVAVSTVADVAVPLDGVRHGGQVRERVAAAVAEHTGTVRVTLSGDVGPDVELDLAGLPAVAPHLAALVVRAGAIRVGYDIDALAAERTVRGQFVRDVRAATDLTEGQRQRVLVTGLRALDGRTDLEVV